MDEYRGGRFPLMRLLLILGIVVSVDGLVADIAQLELLHRIQAQQSWTMEEAEANDRAMALINVISLIVLLASTLVFFMWLHSAGTSLKRAGFGLRWSPGWMIGWWFVPFVNLVRPLQVMNDVWRASDPEAPPHSWQSRPLTPRLGLWWFCTLISSFLDNVSVRLQQSHPTVDTLEVATVLSLAGHGLWIIGGILLVLIVSRIHRRLTQAAD